jgi:transposase-like protein
MARKQNTPSREEWKAALVELVKEGDYLRTVVQKVVQQILEAEMDEALGAEKGERTPSRRGYRSGHYPRTLITRVASWNCECRRTGRGTFAQKS